MITVVVVEMFLEASRLLEIYPRIELLDFDLVVGFLLEDQLLPGDIELNINIGSCMIYLPAFIVNINHMQSNVK